MPYDYGEKYSDEEAFCCQTILWSYHGALSNSKWFRGLDSRITQPEADFDDLKWGFRLCSVIAFHTTKINHRDIKKSFFPNSVCGLDRSMNISLPAPSLFLFVET